MISMDTAINSVMTAAEIVVAVQIFAHALPRRKGYLARAVVVTACLSVFLAYTMTAFLDGSVPAVVPVFFVYCIVLVSCVAAVRWCHETSTWTALFCVTAGYTMQNLASGISGYVFMNAPGLSSGGFAAFAVVNAIEYGIVYLACYLLLVHRVSEEGFLVEENHGMLFMMLVVILAVIGLDVCIKGAYPGGLDFGSFTMLRIVHAVVCCFVLFAEFEMMYNTRLKTEMAATRQLAADERHQYELSKELIDSINIKCHDIRHQIRHLADGAGGYATVDKLVLDTIAREVDVYDAKVDTANDALNVILTEKSLACESHGISLSCMADGRAVEFMSPADIYSLFGNALDNAIEAVEKIPDSERRRISLVLRSGMGMVSLHVENYFVGEVTFSDGLPRTSKADANNHGFGTLSMRRIAEQYGGTFVASVEGSTYLLDVLIPIPEDSVAAAG